MPLFVLVPIETFDTLPVGTDIGSVETIELVPIEHLCTPFVANKTALEPFVNIPSDRAGPIARRGSVWDPLAEKRHWVEKVFVPEMV